MSEEHELLLELLENRELLIKGMRKVGSLEEGLMRGWLLRAKRILSLLNRCHDPDCKHLPPEE